MKKYIIIMFLLFGASLHAQVFNPAQQKVLTDSLTLKARKYVEDTVDVHKIKLIKLEDSTASISTRSLTNEDSTSVISARTLANKDSVTQQSTEIINIKSNLSTVERDSVKTHSFLVLNPQANEEFAMFYAFEDYIIHEVSGHVVGGSVTINIYFDPTCYNANPTSGIWDQDNMEITTSTTNPLDGVGAGLYVSQGRWVWVKIISLPEVAATELQLTIKYSLQ